MEKRLLLRADDLGFSEGINFGIAKTVQDGLIKTVGIMPNMPAAAHGISLLKNDPVCFGQHTNICVGRPLVDPARIPSIVGENGEFKSSSTYRSAKEDFVVLDEVVLEIEAQYQRFVELTGEQPHYFEGHAVASINFFKGLEIVAKRHGLRYLAFTFDGSPIPFGAEKLYLHMESMKPDYEPFTALKEIEYHADGVDMFVCHPGYLDAYILEK
jgi:predicted glycoside hydrolase/deacetylase ChbG (UPF0249 family)